MLAVMLSRQCKHQTAWVERTKKGTLKTEKSKHKQKI